MDIPRAFVCSFVRPFIRSSVRPLVPSARAISKLQAIFKDNALSIISKKSVERPSTQKRWFEGQRWLNRFDYKFTLIRRLGLQAFLRDVFRIENIAERSAAVQKFVGLKEAIHSMVGELDINVENHY